MNFGRDNLTGCDSFISSPTGRWGMAMVRKAWPNALNAQLFKIKVGVYFRGVLFPIKNDVGFFLRVVYFRNRSLHKSSHLCNCLLILRFYHAKRLTRIYDYCIYLFLLLFSQSCLNLSKLSLVLQQSPFLRKNEILILEYVKLL